MLLFSVVDSWHTAGKGYLNLPTMSLERSLPGALRIYSGRNRITMLVSTLSTCGQRIGTYAREAQLNLGPFRYLFH